MTDRSQEQPRLLSSLGLCARAGKLVLGTEQVCLALRETGKKRPVLVLEAADTSEGTHKKLTDKCRHYGVRHERLPHSGTALAAAVGKSAFTAAIALCDGQMCRMLEQYLSQQ